MIEIRKSEERGHAQHGWLDSHHTFSFADYYDPKHMGFRTLRVINEDRVDPGQGFGTHGHRDMEILSYVLQGQIAHRDSMGNQEVLGPNEIQRMSAGTGVKHSEFNPSSTEPLHFFQVWIQPAKAGTQPGYEQIKFDPTEKRNQLKLLASPDGEDGAAWINQDAKMYVAELEKGVEIPHALGADRAAWVHVVRGEVSVNGKALKGGDAAAVSGEALVTLLGRGAEPSEVLLFDLR
ncbi:MAG: pirin family protein [Bryobacteraceae bacterium]